MQTLKSGDNAPSFTLQNQRDESISLNALAGKKALVYFYPKAMTPGCTTQAQNLRDHISALAELNVTVLGISPDPVVRLTKFSERDELNFDLLADPDHAVADAFGVWGLKKFMGKEFDGIHRLSFLIDEQGTIEHVFTSATLKAVPLTGEFSKFKTKDHHQVVLDYLTNK
jgi:peroxiredoxin Q/BCP